MRISTNMIYASSIDTMSNLQSSVLKLTEQATAGKVLRPSDDPIASARALDVTQSQAINTQYGINRQNANSTLTQTETALRSTTTALTNVKSQIIAAGNGSYSDKERADIAISLSGTFQELQGYSNSTDGLGNYLFAGYKSNTQPFVGDISSITYKGDQGVQTAQVDATRTIATTVSGQAVFQSKGGDVFATLGKLVTLLNTPITTAANQTEAAKSLVVYNAAQTAALAVPGTTADQAAATATLAQEAYDNDTTRTDFTVGSTGALNAGLSVYGKATQQAMDNVGTITAGVGSSMNELDALDDAGSAKNVQYADTISKLMGNSSTDMVDTLSKLSQQQLSLQAAQKAFSITSSLSLLKFLT